MGYKETFYPESKFGGFSDMDGTLAFYLRVNALLTPASVAVDYGCGRGAYGDDRLPLRRELRILKGKVSRVIGLDIEEAGATNPFLDEFHLLKGSQWPIVDNSIDLVVCDSVIEHLEQPQLFFSEAWRSLKPGGYVCIRTPNLWGYVALLSRLIPNPSHNQVLSKVKERTNVRDVFPTLYRCNTIPALDRQMEACGFAHIVYGFGAEPAYLSFSKIAYWLGVLYQRYAPGFLQPVLFAFGQKLSESQGAGGQP